jgi:tetratricopeptide (TPR) repeat protein
MRWNRFLERYHRLRAVGLSENAGSLCVKYARAQSNDASAVVGCTELVLENHPEGLRRMEWFLKSFTWRRPGHLEAQAALLRVMDCADMADDLNRFMDEVNGFITLNMMEEASRLCLGRDWDFTSEREVLAYTAGVVTLAGEPQIREARERLADYVGSYPDDHGVRQRYALLLFSEGKPQESVQEFARVPDWALNPAERWMWLQAFMRVGRPEAVHAWFTDTWPHYASWVRRNAFDYYLKFLWTVSFYWAAHGRLDLADRGYRTLLGWDATSTVWLLEHGRVLRALGQAEKAEDTFRTVLNLKPSEIDDQFLYPHAIAYAADHERWLRNEILREVQSTAFPAKPSAS